ncbi:hypothetical protein V7200_17000 [Cytobacillus firmus]|uniref:Uncharacterized protein n=1 Tax=Cytobacillus firmus TaxID=1399 RepID=A0A800MY99_CYTFI|nr:hypothetical protein [Cytobacillus firmus]KAF0824654.1 hypothetical protein KIS1582_1575 [Cytobacillus firmus]
MLTKVNVKWKEDAVSHFMTELIDYAGLFPPAALPLPDAIKNYHSYIYDSDSWMLGPFVIPASKLKNLDSYRAQFNHKYPLRLSVILTDLDHVESDLKTLEHFLEVYQTAGTIEALEVPLSFTLDSQFFRKLNEQSISLRIFCEVAGAFDQLAASLDTIQQMNQESSKQFGVKMRMGGLTPNLFPQAEKAAFVIHESNKRALELKFTAGLHHPIRQYRDEVKTYMHGFVNVFTASIMAYSLSIEKEYIQAILLDEQPDNFKFTTNTLSWRNLTVRSSEISEARSFFAASYGCCSFDEPRNELGELRLYQGDEMR